MEGRARVVGHRRPALAPATDVSLGFPGQPAAILGVGPPDSCFLGAGPGVPPRESPLALAAARPDAGLRRAFGGLHGSFLLVKKVRA